MEEVVKLCPKCGQAKTRFVSARTAKPYYKCVPCRDAYMYGYRVKNADRIKEVYAVYCDLNSTNIARFRKEYQQKNRDWILDWKKQDRLVNKDKIAEYMGKYRKENKYQFDNYNNTRRLRKLLCAPKYGDVSKIKLFYEERDKLKDLTGEKHCVDHIVPIKSWLVCGLHWEHNLQVLTYIQNSSKGNRWWPQMPDYSDQDLHELKYYKWLSEEAI